jgi:hypothetical protein
LVFMLLLARGTDLARFSDKGRQSAEPSVNRLARLVTIWLIAALSLVGWLIVNLDTAGWILVLLTIGLMTFELTRRPARHSRPWRRGIHDQPDEPNG